MPLVPSAAQYRWTWVTTRSTVNGEQSDGNEIKRLLD